MIRTPTVTSPTAAAWSAEAQDDRPEQGPGHPLEQHRAVTPDEPPDRVLLRIAVRGPQRAERGQGQGQPERRGQRERDLARPEHPPADRQRVEEDLGVRLPLARERRRAHREGIEQRPAQPQDDQQPPRASGTLEPEQEPLDARRDHAERDPDRPEHPRVLPPQPSVHRRPPGMDGSCETVCRYRGVLRLPGHATATQRPRADARACNRCRSLPGSASCSPSRRRPATCRAPRPPRRSRGRASAPGSAALSASISSIGSSSGGARGWSRPSNVRVSSEGPGAELVERLGEDQAALVQERDVAGDPLDLGDLVAREEDRPARAGQVDHALEELAAHQEVEPRGRLVEDQELGLRGQGQRERDLGPHPLREVPDLPIGRQAEARDEAPIPLLVQAAGPPTPARGGTRRRTSRSRRRSSSRRGSPARGRSRPAGGPPGCAATGRGRASRPAPRRARSARAGLDRRRLARPVLPQQPEDRARRHVEREPVDGDLAPIPLRHLLDPDRVGLDVVAA